MASALQNKLFSTCTLHLLPSESSSMKRLGGMPDSARCILRSAPRSAPKKQVSHLGNAACVKGITSVERRCPKKLLFSKRTNQRVPGMTHDFRRVIGGVLKGSGKVSDLSFCEREKVLAWAEGIFTLFSQPKCTKTSRVCKVTLGTGRTKGVQKATGNVPNQFWPSCLKVLIANYHLFRNQILSPCHAKVVLSAKD